MFTSLARSFLLAVPPIRKRVERLWQLESQVEALRNKLALLEAGGIRESRFYSLRLLHRPLSTFKDSVKVARADVGVPDDAAIVARVLAAYRSAAARHGDLGNSMWKTFFSAKHQALHDVFVAGSVEDAAAILRNPASSELFYGFSMLCSGLFDTNASDDELYAGARQYLDWLLCLAEHLGAQRIFNPEPEPTMGSGVDVDDVLARLDAALGITVSIPNPYPHEAGLATARGVLTDRIPMALYQAWRTSNLLKGRARPRVLEIGAGQGLAAYYSRSFGIDDYTIVDIPFTGLSSGYFLLRTLGADAVALFGEERAGAERMIKVLPPQAFLEQDLGAFDLIVNVDSLTEMDERVADAYLGKARATSAALLSINHEGNRHTVREWIERNRCASYQRVPCYIRKGYAEEVVFFE